MSIRSIRIFNKLAFKNWKEFFKMNGFHFIFLFLPFSFYANLKHFKLKIHTEFSIMIKYLNYQITAEN